jgi:hypothetical protein
VTIPDAGEQVYRSLYSPGTGQISCVIMQAAYRLDRAPCHFFGSGDWNTGMPAPDSRIMEATESQWRAVGRMSRAERIAMFAHPRGDQ